MKTTLTFAVIGVSTGAAQAADLAVSVEIPRMSVAEYHRPYVAMWIEDESRKVAANLEVWYDVDMRADEGEKWLADLRGWWRKAGRSLDMPVDGVSGPTRAPGTHQVARDGASRTLRSLKPGSYTLKVEAAREVGGREMLSIPFQWPPKASDTKRAEGKTELGTVSLALKP